MRDKTLLYIWGGMFILCGLLGFIPEPQGVLSWALTTLAGVFFLPGGILLYRSHRDKSRLPALVVRNVSLCSLGTTLVLLVLNFLSANASEAAGDFLYGVLTMVSAPMVCSQYWVFSLFAWACLLMTSLSCLKKRK